ncbi:hypothetical protein D9619_001546 [Psilocybe cf. subviscida]|uniref:Uncharacterized protein n=1 Tax=Psilocybe cf. subviscida TaxID=2480587 RepID=A0A8H5BFL8_9AGAR|nr:hypothetical protein D9619_001546 [Psilocybe cf. subviscida]
MFSGSLTNILHEATRTLSTRAESSSEVASLGGKKALTPIIAGSICGAVIFLLWGIGFIVYFRKRWRRKQRNRLIRLGKAEPREKDLEIAKEKIVIPPDPAVLLGQRQAGDNAFPERQKSEREKMERQNSQSRKGDGERGRDHLRPPWSRHNSRKQTVNLPPPIETPQTSTEPNTVQDSPVESTAYMTAEEGTPMMGPRKALP